MPFFFGKKKTKPANKHLKKFDKNENHDEECKSSSDSIQSDFLAKKPTKIEKICEIKVEDKCENTCEKKESKCKIKVVLRPNDCCNEIIIPKDSDCLLKDDKDNNLVCECKRSSEDVLDINDEEKYGNIWIKSATYLKKRTISDLSSMYDGDKHYAKSVYNANIDGGSKKLYSEIIKNNVKSEHVTRPTYSLEESKSSEILIKSTHYEEYPESDDGFNHAHEGNEYTISKYKHHRKPHTKRDPPSSKNIGKNAHNTYKTLSKDSVYSGDKHYPICTYSVNKDYNKANGRLYSEFIHDEKVTPKGEKYNSDALNKQSVLKKMHQVKYESNDSDVSFEDPRKFQTNDNAEYKTFHSTNVSNADKSHLTSDVFREKMKKIHSMKKNFKKNYQTSNVMDRETKHFQVLSDNSDRNIKGGKITQNEEEVSHYPRKKSFEEKTGKRIDKNLLKKSGVLEVFEKIEHIGSELSSSIELIKASKKKRHPSSIYTEEDSSLEKTKHTSLYADYPKYTNYSKRNNGTLKSHKNTVFSEERKSNNRISNYSRKYKISSDQSSYEEFQKENAFHKNTVEKQLNNYFKHKNDRNQHADKHFKKINRKSKKAYENDNKDYNLSYPVRRQVHQIQNKHSEENTSKPTFNQRRYERFSNNHNSSKFKEHNQNDSVTLVERKHSHYRINSETSIDQQDYKISKLNRKPRNNRKIRSKRANESFENKPATSSLFGNKKFTTVKKTHSHYLINSDSSVDVKEYKVSVVNKTEPSYKVNSELSFDEETFKRIRKKINKSNRFAKNSRNYKYFSRPANLPNEICSSSYFCSDSEIDHINKYKKFTKKDSNYLRFCKSNTDEETNCDSTCNKKCMKCADTKKIRNKKVRRKSVPYNEFSKKYRKTPISTLSKDFSTFSKNSYARRKINSNRCHKNLNVDFFQESSTSGTSVKSFVCKSYHGKKHGKISRNKRKKKYNYLKEHKNEISRCTFSGSSSSCKTKQKLNSRSIGSSRYNNYKKLTNTCEEWSTESECVENKCIQTEIESSCEEECKKRKKKKIPSRFQSIIDLTEENCGCTNNEDSKSCCEQKCSPKNTCTTNTRCFQEKHNVTHLKRPKSKKNKLNYRVNQNFGFNDQCDRTKKNKSIYHVSDSSCTSHEPQAKQRNANEKPNVEGACMTFPLFLLTMISNLVGVD